MPLTASVPFQPSAAEPPVAVQMAPGDAVQVSVTGVPTVVDAALDEMLTFIDAMPESGIATGTPPEITVSAPVRSPAAVGAKVTMIVQLAPAARTKLEGQSLVSAKSPEALTLNASEVGPEFLRDTDCAALTVPTACAAKDKFAGARSSHGPCNR